MLNFVMVSEDKDSKHFAWPEKVPTNQNLAHYCDEYEGYDETHIVIMHYCKSHKEACELARTWNEGYKANGTYKEF